MDVERYIDMIQKLEVEHNRDENGVYNHDYFFKLEQDYDGISLAYLIAESVTHLSIDIKKKFDFKKIIKYFNNTIDFTVLEISIEYEDIEFNLADLEHVLKLRNVEKITLNNFGYVTDMIIFDNINIRHLDTLILGHTHEDWRYKDPKVKMTSSCKHRLEIFEGHLDTWDSLGNVLSSSYVEHCQVTIVNSDNLTNIYANIVDNLIIHSDSNHYEIMKKLNIQKLNKINIIKIRRK